MQKMFITGIGGLVGSAVARYAAARQWTVLGCDSDFRGRWFGEAGSVRWRIEQLRKEGIEVIDGTVIGSLPPTREVDVVVHCAGQPSHDFSKQDPFSDVEANYLSTLFLLEYLREHNPKVRFVYISTNKVYGDRVNELLYETRGDRFVPLGGSRWIHPVRGVNELCPLDGSRHTPFGVSKLAADLLVQEYSLCHGMTACTMRCGCITGSSESAVELHGFLGYLVRCAVAGIHYNVYGHRGFQVRDNLVASDLAAAIMEWAKKPHCAAFNIGGGSSNSISVREAISHLHGDHGLVFSVDWEGAPRYGDHMWWVSDMTRFQALYPNWRPRIGVMEAINEMVISAKRSGAVAPAN